MQIAESEAAMRLFARQRGVDVEAPASATQAASTWLSFYEEVRTTGTVADPGAWPDTLLFEFGTREALPGYYEACFYVNLTRQFISEEGEDDDAMFQLTWLLEYEPKEDLRALGHLAVWCDTPKALAAFRTSVLSDAALLAVSDLTARKVDFHFTPL